MRSILVHAIARVRPAVLAMFALLLVASAAGAQANRLALVVGIADYGETRHPTAAADAGLVGQTLQAAGFEVIGGVNLTQGEFRELARNFLDRAQQMPRDGIVAVYLAGLGVQDEGENYFLPAAARIGQRADLAIEAVRLADYLRALTDLPVAARLVMVDAAYLHPLTYLAVSGGRGLALTDRMAGLLLAMNQSPGQSAGLPRTNYGHYAMALAEALNEPGLDLEALFQRVRLRVHDLSGGSETPWHANGIGAPLVINRTPATSEASTLRGIEPPPPPGRPAIASGPEEAYAVAVEIDTIAAYEDFLRAWPDHALARKVRAVIAARREAAFWQKTRRANAPNAYWTYLRHYPKGPHAAEARRRLDRLSASLAPPPDFVVTAYDDLPPPPPEEIVVFEDVVIEDRWEEISTPYAAPPAYLPPPPLALIEAPPPPPPGPLMKTLPAVPVAIGAAILANRVWKRPEPVRPRFVPPPGGPGFAGRPGFVDPGRPPGAPPGAIRQPGAGQPGPGQPLRPGAIPQPGQPPQAGIVAPPPTVQPLPVPTAPRPPGQPGLVPPVIGSPQAPPRPGTVVPLRPGQPNAAVPPATPKLPPATVAVPPPGQQKRPPAPVVQPGSVPPGGGRAIVVTPPGAPRPPSTITAPRPGPAPVVNQPVIATPSRPSVPVVRPPRPLADAPPPRGGPPSYRPPPPEYRPPPPIYRPVPPPPGQAIRQPPPQPVYRPVPQAIQPQPVARPAPPPQVFRQPPPQAAPQVIRQPPPVVQQKLPPPQQVPGCPPDLRAQKRC